MAESFGVSPICERRSIEEQPPAKAATLNMVPVSAKRRILEQYIELYSAFGAVGELAPAATETGAASFEPSMEETGTSMACGCTGETIAIATWSRPTTVPEIVRLDCRLSTLTVSPSVPLSSALPRIVR